MQNLTVLQHNVLKWHNPRKHELANLYEEYKPDLVLLNSTGIPDTTAIKLFQYNLTMSIQFKAIPKFL